MQRLAQSKIVSGRFSMVPVRAFGGGHHHDHHDHHDDHHHDDHHHHVEKADPDHKFIAPCNKKTLFFDGMRPTKNVEVAVTNPFRH